MLGPNEIVEASTQPQNSKSLFLFVPRLQMLSVNKWKNFIS